MCGVGQHVHTPFAVREPLRVQGALAGREGGAADTHAWEAGFPEFVGL